MKKIQSKNSYVLRLRKGDEIIESLLNFCRQNDIKSASLFAVGAVSKINLAAYLLSKKEYLRKSFDGPYEIAAMSGNVARLDGDPVAHVHGVFSDTDFNCVAGHIDNAFVSATCEIFLEVYNESLTRKHDEEIGLNLLEI